MISDSTGHMTTLVKNLRLKHRIYSDNADIRALDVFSSQLLVLHPHDISFSSVTDNKVDQFYCEGSFTGEYEFIEMQLERHRHLQSYIYGLTTGNQIIIFDYKYSGQNHDNNFCRLIGRLSIPEEFTHGKSVGFASIRGSIILQNVYGKLLMIDTANESLLQRGQLYYYSPYDQSQGDENDESESQQMFDEKEVYGSHRKRIKIIQAKA